MLAKYFFVAAAVVVGGVMAVKCDSQPQFDLCKQTMQGYIDACAPNDAKCLCTAHENLLQQCYPLCPQDPGKGAEDTMVSSWCVSAGGDKSSSVPVVAATTTASTGIATGTATATTYPTTTSTSTSTDTSHGNNNETTTTTSKPQASGNAGNMLAPAGFMVAAAAVAGLVL